MAVHDKYVALAKRLIAKHGRDLLFEFVQPGATDPDKPWKGPSPVPPVVKGPLKGVSVEYKSSDFGSKFLNEELFVHCTEVILVAGGQEVLEDCAIVIDDGERFGVKAIQRLRPGGQTILYAIGLGT